MFRTNPVSFVLRHLCIILGLTCITFIILNYYNPMMGFLTSGYSQVIIILLAVVSIAGSISALVTGGKNKKD